MTDPRISFAASVSNGADADAIKALLGGSVINIRVGRAALATFTGQILAYQLSTLAVRLFDRVVLVGDDGAPAHMDFSIFQGPFLPTLRGLLPTFRPLEDAYPVIHEISVSIGDEGAADLYLGATGWRACVSRGEPQQIIDSTNPVGALAAGTLGASELFKLAFAGKITGSVPARTYSLSLLDYRVNAEGAEPTLPQKIEIDTALFGSGSIGCGLIACLVLTPQLTGKFAVVDNGRFDRRNPYKYSLIDWDTAGKEGRKASWAKDQIDRYTKGRIQAEGFVGIAREYVTSLPADYKIPVAISAVDTFEARAEIQDTLPARTINAGINGTTAEVSVHGFNDEVACLGCLALQRELESWNAAPIANRLGLPVKRVHDLIQSNGDMTADDIKSIKAAGTAPQELLATVDSFEGQPVLSLWNRVAYSEAPVNVGGAPQPVNVATAFVSAYAGVLLLAELLKECVPELRSTRVNNSYRQDLLGIPAEGIFRYERDQRGWCLCHSSFRQLVHREKYATLA